MVETRNIVILGASYGGLGSTHYIARHALPHLPSDGKTKYRIVLVDPSSKWYLRHASPRATAREDLMPDSLMFQETQSGIKQYGDSAIFIQGTATSFDPESRAVTVRKADGVNETLFYHALVLATGSRTNSPLFSLQGTPHSTNQEALKTIHKQLPNAKRILIAGGGPTGVETAGEIGEFLNGAAGWFSSRPSNPKAQITLYTNSDKLLPALQPVTAKQAETFLNRVGVDVVRNTKISSVRALDNGQTLVTLHHGEEVTADIYIPATGLKPMAEYVPKHLLNQAGYVEMNEETLRVEKAGPRVYAIGDIGSYSGNSIVQVHDSVPILGTNIKRDLLASHDNLNGKPTGPDRKFVKPTAATQLVPIGLSKGVGEISGWRIPSFFVWLMKGRDFMAAKSRDEFLMGGKWAKESAWKPTTEA